MILKEKTVCFTGHRNIPYEDIPMICNRLDYVIRQLALRGYTDFASGGARGFDTLAAQAVIRAMEEFPHLALHLILPCRNHTRGWCQRDIDAYNSIQDCAADILYSSDEYNSYCMFKRNRQLVNMSSVCVCYQTKARGGTAYTVRCARSQGLVLVNLVSSELDEVLCQQEFSIA